VDSFGFPWYLPAAVLGGGALAILLLRLRLARGRLRRDKALAWLHPPSDLGNPEAWDRYWRDQASHRLTPPLFDMFCFDTELVELMNSRSMTSVLCAGNGVSQEPRALAAAGFRVVALDLSPLAAQLATAWHAQPVELERIVEARLHRPGGTVEYATGNILDPTAYPGPFDVIIERRTLQLFPPQQRVRALGALAARLAADGVLVSHCHDRGWRPGAKSFHAVEAKFRQLGWTVTTVRPVERFKARFAWLVVSTG
jgi:hypothetical protein